MNFKLRSIFITILAFAAVICSVIGFTACDGNPVKELVIENARIEFKIGDEFEPGDDFTVYAIYADGTKTDVTEEVEIRKESKFDMNTAGNYQITVSYKGKKEVYTIYVGNFDNILKKIELDTENVKKSYKMGESISFENIKITSTLENAQGNEVTSTTSSLKDFTVTIEHNESGKLIDNAFDAFGGYTVTISRGGIKASYTVSVDGVDISSVQGAVIASSHFKNNIASGNMLYKSGFAGKDPINVFNTEYKFGDNYTYVDEKIENPNIQYISTDDRGLFCLTYDKNTKSYINNRNANEAMMGGPRVLLWYNGHVEYGPENALNNLYNEAKKASNKDLKETADETTKTYSFSFSGLVLVANNSPDYYENTVEFTLSENYALTSLKFTQTEWENDQSYIDGDKNYNTTFVIDPVTGFTSPRRYEDGSIHRYSSKVVVDITQTEGERTETNPYTREMFQFSSYDLTYNGETLDSENPVVKCDVKNPNLVLDITNFEPATANLNVDMMTFNYVGSFNKDSAEGVECEGLYIYRAGSRLMVTLRNGGVWQIILKTENTTKILTFDVTGVTPETISPQIRNESTGAFYNVESGFEKLISINGEIYFVGVVNKYANAAQLVSITSENANSGKIERVTIDGKECYRFTATEKGKYTIKISSAVASVSCELVIDVGDVPDFENILKGNYKVTDRQGSIFELSFTPGGTGGEVSGTFTVKKTPTNEDDTPITDEIKNETYSFSVDFESLTINVKSISGDKLAVNISVDASGNLVLEDQYGDKYVLERVTE